MGRKEKMVKPLDTIWEVSNELWAEIEPILLEDAPLPPTEEGGRERADWRPAFNGIIYRMRTGCRWNHLPKELGDDSSIHRRFQRWNRNGVMEKIWASPVSECEELGAVRREWQSADGAMGKARFGGDEVGPNPTDRGKDGTKRGLIVDEDGGPLGAVIAGANVHDTKLLEATIEAVVVGRPEPTKEGPQNLCLDKGHDNPTGHAAAAAKGHTPRIRRIGEEKAVRRGEKSTSRGDG
jgi:putative transposase